MYVSGKLLVGVALLSGVAAGALIIKTPVIRQVKVFRVTHDLTRADIIEVGTNVEVTSISAGAYAAHPEKYVSATLKSLVDGRRVVRNVAASTPLSAGDVVTTKLVAGTGDGSTEGYQQLSGQLRNGERAVPISSTALSTFEYTLEPGDVIDLLVPGGALAGSLAAEHSFKNLRVLAVGARSEAGWTGKQHQGTYRTVTLAVEIAVAERIAAVFADGTVKPLVLLHPKS